MFDMQLPWWEFILRGAIVYGVLLVMVRLSGKRTVGQFTPFDLLVVMLLSEAVSNSLSGGDDSLIGGLLIAATLIGLNGLIAFGNSRSRKFSEMMDGSAVLLGRDGQIFDTVVKKCRLSQADINQALRESDCALKEMQCAFLEVDGNITILKKSSASQNT
ncbi:MAG: YetF domain-containing protein [Pseudomonadota bacterium]